MAMPIPVPSRYPFICSSVSDLIGSDIRSLYGDFAACAACVCWACIGQLGSDCPNALVVRTIVKTANAVFILHLLGSQSTVPNRFESQGGRRNESATPH